MQFKLYLKHHRIIKNLTQLELARKSGLTQQFISQLESNERAKSPTLRTIEILAKALDICPYLLIEYSCETCNKTETCKLKNIFNY